MRKSGSGPVWFQDRRKQLEFPIQGQYFVPGIIDLDGDCLVWSWRGDEKPFCDVGGMLNRFLRLEDGPAERIINCARRYGVLHPCPVHDRPAVSGLGGLFCNTHREPLGDWRAYSRQFAAMFQIAIDIDAGRPGDRESWASFYNGREVHEVGKDANSDRCALVAHLNSCLFSAMTRPTILVRPPNISSRGDQYEIGFSVPSLYAALAMESILIVARHNIAICASCGNLFSPKLLKPGCDTYCDGPNCGKKASGRAAQHRRYERKKSGPAGGNKPAL
jgi:hypothetical protein